MALCVVPLFAMMVLATDTGLGSVPSLDPLSGLSRIASLDSTTLLTGGSAFGDRNTTTSADTFDYNYFFESVQGPEIDYSRLCCTDLAPFDTIWPSASSDHWSTQFNVDDLFASDPRVATTTNSSSSSSSTLTTTTTTTTPSTTFNPTPSNSQSLAADNEVLADSEEDPWDRSGPVTSRTEKTEMPADLQRVMRECHKLGKIFMREVDGAARKKLRRPITAYDSNMTIDIVESDDVSRKPHPTSTSSSASTVPMVRKRKRVLDSDDSDDSDDDYEWKGGDAVTVENTRNARMSNKHKKRRITDSDDDQVERSDHYSEIENDAEDGESSDVAGKGDALKPLLIKSYMTRLIDLIIDIQKYAKSKTDAFSPQTATFRSTLNAIVQVFAFLVDRLRMRSPKDGAMSSFGGIQVNHDIINQSHERLAVHKESGRVLTDSVEELHYVGDLICRTKNGHGESTVSSRLVCANILRTVYVYYMARRRCEIISGAYFRRDGKLVFKDGFYLETDKEIENGKRDTSYLHRRLTIANRYLFISVLRSVCLARNRVSEKRLCDGNIHADTLFHMAVREYAQILRDLKETLAADDSTSKTIGNVEITESSIASAIRLLEQANDPQEEADKDVSVSRLYSLFTGEQWPHERSKSHLAWKDITVIFAAHALARFPGLQQVRFEDDGSLVCGKLRFVDTFKEFEEEMLLARFSTDSKYTEVPTSSNGLTDANRYFKRGLNDLYEAVFGKRAEIAKTGIVDYFPKFIDLYAALLEKLHEKGVDFDKTVNNVTINHEYIVKAQSRIKEHRRDPSALFERGKSHTTLYRIVSGGSDEGNTGMAAQNYEYCLQHLYCLYLAADYKPSVLLKFSDDGQILVGGNRFPTVEETKRYGHQIHRKQYTKKKSSKTPVKNSKKNSKE